MEEEEDLDNSQNGESKGVISESDLLDIYDTHYYDLFSKILKIDEDKFFSLLQEQVLLTLRIINKLSDLSLMSFFQDLISERYKTDKKKITTDMTKIKTLPENEIKYLDYSNCYIHCHKSLDCFHKCSNKLILYEGFIFCLNCKKVYNENQIKLYCKECNKSYYSKLRENVEETNKFLIPVVFSRPHCEPDNNENEIIKCLECGEDLYYDLSKVKDQKNKPKKLSDSIKDLVCPNCKLIYDTKEIGFNCIECDEEFTSDALLYNDFSIHKKRILFLVHTLMKAIVALPDNYDEKKCKCDINSFKEFTHIDDNGFLLKGYKDEDKIVCKECFEVFEKNNFEWKCPSCGEVFKSEKIENKDINDNDIKNEDNQNEIKNDDKDKEDDFENNEDEEYEENDNENIIRDNSEDEKNNINENEIENNNEDDNINNNDIDNKNENDIQDNSQNEFEDENENENNDEVEAEDGNENNNEVEAEEGNKNENDDIQNEEFEEEEEIKDNIKEKENKDQEVKKEEIKKEDKKEEVKKEIIKKEDNKKEIIKKEVIRKEIIKKEDNKKEDNKNNRKIIIINNSKDKKETDYKKYNNYNNYKNNSSNNYKVYDNYKRKENKIEEKKDNNNYKYKVDLTKYKMNNNNNKISKNQNSLINNKENIDKNKYNSNINKIGSQNNNIKRSDKKVNHNYTNIQNINKNNYNNEPKYDYKKQYNKEIVKNYKNDKEKEPQKIYKNVSSKYIYDSKKNNNNNISLNSINRNNNDIQKRTEYINNNNNFKSNNINSRQNHQIININDSNRNNDKRKRYILNEEQKKEVKIIKNKDIKDKENENKVKEKEKENKENKNRQNKSKENIIKESKSRDNKSRENKSKENKNKIVKFKNIQKYFEDFNEEYEKENEYKNKLKEKIKNKHKNLRESAKEDKKPLKYNINNVHIISNVSNNDLNNLKKENNIYNYTDSNNNSNKNNVHIISQFNSKKDNVMIKKDNEGNLPENKIINSNKNLPKRQSYIKSNNYQNENKNNVSNEPKKQDIAMNDKSHKNDLNQKLIYIKNDKNKKKENENEKEDKQKNIIKQELENKDEPNNEEKNIINSNNYKNLKILGHGSYGKIYLVEEIKTKAKYAMKKLIIGDSLELKDNQDEYNMIMKITELYPELNIIHVFGTETKKFDDYNYVFYILMEVANCDWEKELMNRAKNKAYYTEEELFFILESLVDTFSYLQQIGICHRDIKPQNILCFGEKGYKISDFGEAKYRKKWRLQQSEIEYTAMQTIRGTELYMSPILYVALKTAPNKGANHNVFKSDVFSLGMCFLFASCLDYKCLYSVRRATDMNKLRAVIEQYVNKRYSQNFIEILLWMLHLNEKERPDFIELSAMV